MKRIILLAIFLMAASTAFAQRDLQQVPDLPIGCEHLQVPEGNELAYRVYASGVQVYWWNGTSWGFVGPIATLYANSGMTGKVGLHYGGPTWKSNSGSLVIGKSPVRCTPDPDSIQWLRLEADETDGSGIFNGVTYIQRLNTNGGKAPVEPGSYDGETVEVPYTTEYYFYRPTAR